MSEEMRRQTDMQGSNLADAAETCHPRPMFVGVRVPRVCWAISIFTFILAPFGRGVYDAIIGLISRDTLAYLLWFILVTAVGAILLFAKEMGLRRVGLLGFVALMGFWGAFSLPMIEEKVHVILFGLLGFFLVRANSAQQTWQHLFLVVLIFGAVIGTLDEVIQSFSPGRVGDPRDVAVNVLSTLWGGMLGYLSRRSVPGS